MFAVTRNGGVGNAFQSCSRTLHVIDSARALACARGSAERWLSQCFSIVFKACIIVGGKGVGIAIGARRRQRHVWQAIPFSRTTRRLQICSCPLRLSRRKKLHVATVCIRLITDWHPTLQLSNPHARWLCVCDEVLCYSCLVHVGPSTRRWDTTKPIEATHPPSIYLLWFHRAG